MKFITVHTEHGEQTINTAHIIIIEPLTGNDKGARIVLNLYIGENYQVIITTTPFRQVQLLVGLTTH